jgi:hypothetical protein
MTGCAPLAIRRLPREVPLDIGTQRVWFRLVRTTHVVEMTLLLSAVRLLVNCTIGMYDRSGFLLSPVSNVGNTPIIFRAGFKFRANLFHGVAVRQNCVAIASLTKTTPGARPCPGPEHPRRNGIRKI